MNPYEYDTTLDCRDVDNRVGGGGGAGPGVIGVLRGQPGDMVASTSQHNTLQHQNHQNLQLQQQQQQQQQQQSHYDYEYQHLQHRPPNEASGGGATATRSHGGRQGFLLEGGTPSAPPDVPPRNPTMNRFNSSRLMAGGMAVSAGSAGSGNSNDLDLEFEPSHLIRTPSGNPYIPTGNTNLNKGSPIDYKSGSACSTPTKDTLKGYERNAGPVLPPRSTMGGIATHHYSAPMNFRKDLAARCSSKCVVILAICIVFVLGILLLSLIGFGVLHWSPSAPCTVLVGNEASEVTAAKSTNSDLLKMQNTSLRSKTGQPPIAVTTSTASAATGSSSGGGGGGTSLSTGLLATSASSIPTVGGHSSSSSSLANPNSSAAPYLTADEQMNAAVVAAVKVRRRQHDNLGGHRAAAALDVSPPANGDDDDNIKTSLKQQGKRLRRSLSLDKSFHDLITSIRTTQQRTMQTTMMVEETTTRTRTTVNEMMGKQKSSGDAVVLPPSVRHDDDDEDDDAADELEANKMSMTTGRPEAVTAAADEEEEAEPPGGSDDWAAANKEQRANEKVIIGMRQAAAAADSNEISSHYQNEDGGGDKDTAEFDFPGGNAEKLISVVGGVGGGGKDESNYVEVAAATAASLLSSAAAAAGETLKINNVLNINQSNNDKGIDDEHKKHHRDGGTEPNNPNTKNNNNGNNKKGDIDDCNFDSDSKLCSAVATAKYDDNVRNMSPVTVRQAIVASPNAASTPTETLGAEWADATVTVTANAYDDGDKVYNGLTPPALPGGGSLDSSLSSSASLLSSSLSSSSLLASSTSSSSSLLSSSGKFGKAIVKVSSLSKHLKDDNRVSSIGKLFEDNGAPVAPAAAGEPRNAPNNDGNGNANDIDPFAVKIEPKAVEPPAAPRNDDDAVNDEDYFIIEDKDQPRPQQQQHKSPTGGIYDDNLKTGTTNKRANKKVSKNDIDKFKLNGRPEKGPSSSPTIPPLMMINEPQTTDESEELMLNDGGGLNGALMMPEPALSSHQPRLNAEDVDIVKLDATDINSTEDEVYKTIKDQRNINTQSSSSSSTSMKWPRKPLKWSGPPTSSNRHKMPFLLKPQVNEVYDQPSKRILVNLTIATGDTPDSVYTLHVAIPASADGSGKQQNLEQVLTHEHMRLQDSNDLDETSKEANDLKETNKEANDLDETNNNIETESNGLPYCVPEPPPPIPECPCFCGAPNLSKDETFDELSTTTLASTPHDPSTVNTDVEGFTTTERTSDDQDDDETQTTNTLSTATNMPPAATASGDGSNRTTEASACPVCPDVMPILILEGARTFPARSFPPDGTTFGQITLGQKLTKEILPYSYWNMQFYQSEPAYVKFDYTIPRGSSIGVYGRRNALPTHTQYHFKEVLSGFTAAPRTARAAHLSITREVTRYMEPGHWFISLYNDDGDPQEVTYYGAIAEDMTQNCPNGCSGNGQCLLGHCQCNAGFGGDDCSESVCPVLCSQHGEYINGECICNPGWKGKECSLRHDECEVADCSGHGHCVSGKCQCMRGYKGKFCEEVDCPHPTCSGHGFCADGTCICKKGWKGSDCATMDQDALQCLPDCSGHGNFDLETQSCTCEAKWSGEDCSKELCDLDCGQHGRCVGDACLCDANWGGEYCNTKLCDARCNEHGQCKNGTCLCVTGWNGKHCTIEGCPNSCSGHGQCRVSGEGQWECRCYEGWDGADCGIALELNCGDSKDNDKDGLVDCEDPECCASHVCKTSQLCVSAPKPIDVLLRKQPPAITASFFERMKFLIDESSLQNYAKIESFNESIFWNYFNASRSAVIRGRVVTSLGMGLVGVRVSTTTLLEGFTLTRDDGWFDLMVNGGGAVTLQFGRSPFRRQSRIVHVPWNEVIIIDVVVMSMADEKGLAVSSHTCFSHDYDVMKPVVLASWKHGFQGACPDRSAILAESQVIQESLQIPGTGLNLVYHSSRAAGYLSTIKLQLTPETIPETLHLIHLRITIEGILFERVFEADPGIKFTYAWNRLNIYRQRVYGVTTAIVKVGYQYSDCKDIIWDIQTTKLSGHDMSISEVGGWNLDIHHRYNFHEGILQKGDGSNIYLKNKPRVILTTMGDGHQRPLDCSECDGLAIKQRLLAPVALAASPDGSLYIGDFNYIRRILTDGTVRTICKLNATRVSYRYHMALSPLDGTLYISDPESHQIIRVKDTNDFTQPDKNWEPIVGSGERCLPGDEAHCGDGALAKDAKLAYPKGIAVSSDNILYFADGTNIRMVDRDGIVTTLIGNHMHKSHWKPIPCEGTLKLEEMHLRWPTELAVSPLDNTLHIIDDHMILRMTPDERVRVISGRPLHCATGSSVYDSDLATHATLVMPQSIAFGPMGELYVAESDSQRINRVRVIGTDGRILAFAGAESKCNCLERGCDCFEADHFLATSAKFNTIAALAVTPDGHVHIADQANYRIRSVMSSIPEASTSREYEIYAPDMQEIYIFNRFGQHVSTRNILTGETTYVFTYNVNTSNGKLSTVTDAAGNKVFLLRDYSAQVNSIENTKGQKCRLRMTRMKMLHELSTPDNYNVTFEYQGPTGLLKTKLDSTGRSYVYNYDEFGRLTSAVTPTGRVIELAFDLSVKGAQVRVSENAQKEVSMLIQGSTVLVRNGEAETKTSIEIDGSTTSITPWGHTLQMEVVPYPILAEINPVIGESYPVPAKQRTEIAGDLANRFEWRYFIRRLQPGKQGKAARPVSQVGRKLRVNGDNVLSLEYDRETQSIVVMVDDKQELLNVTYDRTARPVSFRPQSGDYADVDLEYDRFGRLVSWKWGVLHEAYTFDRNGRLNEIKYGDGSSMIYAFKDMFGSLPLKVTTPRRSDYLLQYDDAGALQSLTTPRGHIHSFSLQTSLGFFKYQYFSPINRHPFEILYNDEGQILAKIHPHQSGKVAFVHDKSGRLETVLAGMSSTHYSYQDASNLLKSVEVQEPGFELHRDFKYHAGILKEDKLHFGPKSTLASAHYKYAYDGNARLSGIEITLGDKEMPPIRHKYSQNLGQLEVVQDLKITRNAFNRTVIQDSGKLFFTIIDYDQHGRIKSVLMNIKSFDVFRLELDYDLRNRIKSQKTTFGRSTAFDKVAYNADGHVIEITGTNNWKYLYDENGNTVGIVDQGEKINLGYDIGDRVIQIADVESNNYDARGFVVRSGEQKFRYNNRGQLMHAFVRDRFQSWYFYDDRSRLVSWRDSKGNLTQYFYANPRTPMLVTHMYYPRDGKTLKFYYDDRNVLIAIENSEQRFYVATDQNGSPLAFFDLNGTIVKEVKRTPFGRTIKDTNPDFFVPIDFHGGLVDPNTKLIYMNGRQYDPSVGQWMTPLWETLATKMSNPTDVFIYRFNNNDPINPARPQNYMIDLESWLKLFGFDLKNMQSAKYTKDLQYVPQASINSNTLAPDFGVISGLECIVEKTNERFAEFDFVPKPLLKMEPKMRNLLPRVSYRRGVFGEGVLLSRIAGRAMVSVVDGSNSVVQDVVSSVFNNSYFLDLHFSIHDQDVFYFVKDNALKLRDDNEELRRLGGMFNISTHEITEHGGSSAKELRLHGPDAVVFIKYGVDPEQERHRILKHSHKRAVERAWELEKQLVAAGFQGRGDWTEEEKEELVSHGDVDGWIGVDIHSIHKYPQLADDPGNVAFQRDAKRKRRKTATSHRASKTRRSQKQAEQSE